LKAFHDSAGVVMKSRERHFGLSTLKKNGPLAATSVFLTLLYMECVVINLKRNTKRWEMVHAALVDAGISHRRFDAIDGRTVGAKYNHLMAPGTNFFTPRGVLGCALSHYLVLQEFIAGEFETCLILEDDARLVPNCTDNLARIMKAAPKDWDMIKLASYPNYEGPDLLVRRTISLNTVALLITRPGAEKILQKRIAWPSHADVALWFIPKLNTYVANKRLCPTFYQTWNTSSIAGQRYPRYDMNLKVVRLGPWEVVVGDVLVILVAVVAWNLFKPAPKKKSKRV